MITPLISWQFLALVQASQNTHLGVLFYKHFSLTYFVGKHALQTSSLEGLEVSAYFLNPPSHLAFASQEPWRCLAGALLPPGFVLCSTASEVTYLLICYLENHPSITSVITPVSFWPQRSGESLALLSMRRRRWLRTKPPGATGVTLTRMCYLAGINWGEERWGEVVFESFAFLDVVSSFSDQLSVLWLYGLGPAQSPGISIHSCRCWTVAKSQKQRARTDTTDSRGVACSEDLGVSSLSC